VISPGCLVISSQSSTHSICFVLPSTDAKPSSFSTAVSRSAHSFQWPFALRKEMNSSACVGSSFMYRLYTRSAVTTGTPSRRTNARYAGQILPCCVTGSALRARSNALRTEVILPWPLTHERYISQMRGILCSVASARSNVACSADLARSAAGRPRTARTRSVRYACHSWATRVIVVCTLMWWRGAGREEGVRKTNSAWGGRHIWQGAIPISRGLNSYLIAPRELLHSALIHQEESELLLHVCIVSRSGRPRVPLSRLVALRPDHPLLLLLYVRPP